MARSAGPGRIFSRRTSAARVELAGMPLPPRSNRQAKADATLMTRLVIGRQPDAEGDRREVSRPSASGSRRSLPPTGRNPRRPRPPRSFFRQLAVKDPRAGPGRRSEAHALCDLGPVRTSFSNDGPVPRPDRPDRQPDPPRPGDHSLRPLTAPDHGFPHLLLKARPSPPGEHEPEAASPASSKHHHRQVSEK